MTSIPIDHIIRSARRTVALEITANGQLLIRAPRRAKVADLKQLVKEKAAWIRRKQTEVRARVAQAPPYILAVDSRIPYRGQELIVTVTAQLAPIRLCGNRLSLNPVAGCRLSQTVMAWYIDEAQRLLLPRVHDWATKGHLSVRQIKWSNARRRWGSCSSRGNLNLNWRLILLPPEVADYIVVHEIAHLRYLNHSPAFWHFVAQLMPHYQHAENWLQQHGLRYFF